MNTQKPLIDFTQNELHDAIRASAEHVEYSYTNYRDELFRRSQDEHTKALNKWTKIMAIATVFVTIATIVNVIVVIATIVK